MSLFSKTVPLELYTQVERKIKDIEASNIVLREELDRIKGRVCECGSTQLSDLSATVDLLRSQNKTIQEENASLRATIDKIPQFSFPAAINYDLYCRVFANETWWSWP